MVPEILRDHGCGTYAFGKCHLTNTGDYGTGGSREDWPLGRGFNRRYGFHGALADQWNPELFEDNPEEARKAEQKARTALVSEASTWRSWQTVSAYLRALQEAIDHEQATLPEAGRAWLARNLPMFRDGPLSRRPPEEIRYGTGKSAVGPVLVASSEKGIVTIMVREKPAQLIADVQARFSKADLIRDEKGCAPTVAKVVRYIAAPVGRFRLPLDIRGTDLQKRVWDEVRKIPFGQTSNYSRIAEAIGSPRAIRAVANSCSRSWFAFAVPCHRVLHKGGASSGNRRDGRQYRWVDYEAKLGAKRLKRSAR